MKKILYSILLVFIMIGMFSCKNKTLETPTNVTLSEAGVISWDPVENAQSYIVVINEQQYTVNTPFYLVNNLTNDFTYSVIACADKFENSLPSELLTFTAPVITPPKPPKNDIVVGISGSSEVKSGKTITLTANVTGTENKDVTWEIVEGKDLATISESGVLTANKISDEEGNKVISVVAKSKEDSKAYATKIITIVTKPALTQDMLDLIGQQQYLSFEGYINISLYPFGSNTLYSTYTTVVKTSLDGEYWYAEYENAESFTKLGLYYKKHNGYACQVGVNFMNEEQYEYALDNNGKELSWEEYGLYNNFKGLKVSDFTFDEDTWRWSYTGSDLNLDSRMITSANPYEFKANGFSLIIEEGEILGIYAKSADDYSIAEQYKAIQELIVAVNYGENNVDVKKVPKYTYDEKIHGNLKVALEKMHTANNYTLRYKDIQASSMTSGYLQEGFTEYITENNRYFEPFKTSYDNYGNEVYNNIPNGTYGYKKITDELYNSYYETIDEITKDSYYVASRAYEKTFDHTKPTFAFAPEIFTQYYIDEEDNTTTYYVDELMCPVASTFYYGVGNDINLYGIYASTGYVSETESFTPYVTVDNETQTIIASAFYYYLGYIYGVVEIDYFDYGTTKLPEDLEVEFEVRQVPTSWKELTITRSYSNTSIDEDYEENAVVVLKELFGIADTIEAEEEFLNNMPFFGKPLGDTYGFGLESFHINSQNVNKKAITFYYDVPLDVDYSIESSLALVEEYLLEIGFVKNQAGEFHKGNIWVAPVDQNLDLIIYVWKD